MQKHLIEEVTVAGAPFTLEHLDIPLDKLVLDEANPRIQYRLALDKGSKTIDETILALPEVTKLRKDIELNGGLREKIIVQKAADGKYKVLEGNCRTVCFRSLQAMPKYKDSSTWDVISARVVPRDVEERKVAILLSDLHVAGKIQWKAHEKAGKIFQMSRELKMSEGDISTYLRQSKTTVSRFLNAYAFMRDRFFTIDDAVYAGDGEYKWSFFDELYRSKELREELKRNPEFGDDFCRWVGEGRLPDGIHVRDLPALLKNPEAMKKFTKLPKGTAFAEAMKVVEAADPETGSDFFKLLGKMRDACTNAAQVKEILRIRTDKVARQRILETYSALVDFMHLADLEVPDKEDDRRSAA
jgi:hypothetical protein